MAGELWRGYCQAGVEETFGTAVPATRRMYFRDPVFTRTRDPRLWKFATGTRDNQRAASLGPTVVGGTLVSPVSAEILELLAIGILGGVTGVGAGADKVYTYKPGSSAPSSATFEWHDGARAWVVAGCYAESLQFAGSVSGENLLTAQLFGKSMVTGAMTGALTERVPAIFEGWETKLYIDALAGTPGTTAVAGTLINWDVSIGNQLGRKYFANNTLDLGAVALGELAISARLTFEAAPAGVATEYGNWDAVTERLVRMEFGNNALIGAGPGKEKITVDIPGAWTAVDLGQTDEGTRVYEFSLDYLYDPTNTFGLQVVATTARATVF